LSRIADTFFKRFGKFCMPHNNHNLNFLSYLIGRISSTRFVGDWSHSLEHRFSTRGQWALPILTGPGPSVTLACDILLDYTILHLSSDVHRSANLRKWSCRLRSLLHNLFSRCLLMRRNEILCRYGIRLPVQV